MKENKSKSIKKNYEFAKNNTQLTVKKTVLDCKKFMKNK